jgi:acetyl esterase/lipase
LAIVSFLSGSVHFLTFYFSHHALIFYLKKKKREDKKDHAALARSLAASTSSPVIVPNYRLTTPDNELRHPAHAQDVLELLTFLLSWAGPHHGGRQSLPYDPNRMFLIGHSCSAHMLASILLDSSDPVLVPPVALLRAVRGVVLSEGIYDIDALLQSFPTYRDWFIRDTFGDLPTYDRYSTTKMTLREGATHISWIIVYSSGDTLVDALQSQDMYHHLQSLHQGGPFETDQVSKNWDDLKGDHSAILQSGKYIQIVRDFIHSVQRLS